MKAFITASFKEGENEKEIEIEGYVNGSKFIPTSEKIDAS